MYHFVDNLGYAVQFLACLVASLGWCVWAMGLGLPMDTATVISSISVMAQVPVHVECVRKLVQRVQTLEHPRWWVTCPIGFVSVLCSPLGSHEGWASPRNLPLAARAV
eukprot:gb/GFBE01009282.1/.p1 GENE.gb/GFBE01009282.1/~~gb/GFBE01009282.1/.p1  ORF type:complete len:108 (+),score=4.66 gb/GFBE01009282.1/:1-324(+)